MSIAVFLLLALAARAAGAPGGLALGVAQERTVCRTRVEYDSDAARIPRVIKLLRCAPAPATRCGAGACCGGGGPDVRLACAELRDTVLVSTTSYRTYTMDVPVGCACIRQPSTGAHEIH